MNRKLTLSVDDEIIRKAKKYAQEHKESLSELVENYFRNLTSDKKYTEKSEFSPIVQELLGSVELPEDFNFESEKSNFLEKKYE